MSLPLPLRPCGPRSGWRRANGAARLRASNAPAHAEADGGGFGTKWSPETSGSMAATLTSHVQIQDIIYCINARQVCSAPMFRYCISKRNWKQIQVTWLSAPEAALDTLYGARNLLMSSLICSMLEMRSRRNLSVVDNIQIKTMSQQQQGPEPRH